MASNAPRKSDMTDVQRKLQRNIDLATDTLIAHAAPKVPDISNLTKEGMIEELGRMNIVRKSCEKVENILKVRLKTMIDEPTEEKPVEIRGDNFNLKYELRTRTALDQTKAKAKLEELGILEDYLSVSGVPTMTIKENG